MASLFSSIPRTRTVAFRGTTGPGPTRRTAIAPKRHRKILRDNIRGVTNGAIRRLARRGGVRRISAMIYEDIRSVIRMRLREILEKVVIIVEHPRGGSIEGRKTVKVTDVILVLNRLDSSIYGFDPAFNAKRGARNER